MTAPSFLGLKQRQFDMNAQLDALAAIITTENRALTAEEREQRDRIVGELPGLAADIAFAEERRAAELRADPVPDANQVAEHPSTPTPFASLGEQLMAVRQTALHPHRPDERLLAIQAAQGASEAVGSDGGFFVQHDFQNDMLREVHQGAVLVPRTRKIPISTNSNGVKINGVDETSRATGSRWGGVQAYWTAEAGTLTASKPKYRQIDMELNKLTALYYATDELIQDAAALGSAASQAFTEEMAFKLDDSLLRGTGAGMPLGILGHAGTITVAKEGSQPAASLMPENLWAMYSRQMDPGRAAWFINQDVWPKLHGMTFETGVSGLPVFMPPGGIAAAPYGMILGRPIVPIEHAETIGTEGDIIFADWSQYITIDKGGIQTASSIHVAFLTDEEVFRWILRFDGQPVRAAALTPYKGSLSTSPFVTLATRA